MSDKLYWPGPRIVNFQPWNPACDRMLRTRYIADDYQPARCVTCGEAVSHIRRGDCRCTREARAK